MMSDLYLIRMPGEEERFLLDLPAAGRDDLMAHFKRVMPPRLAKVEDVSADLGQLAVVGPAAAAAIATALQSLQRAEVESGVLDALELDHTWFAAGTQDPICVVRSPDTIPPCYEVFCSRAEAHALDEALTNAGIDKGDATAWEVLRVEAGTPAFGTDMTDRTIPIEAGIEDRAIDGTKGCYTGQEIIVRILHRGHVNRHLRTLRVESPAATDPVPGAELFRTDTDESVGDKSVGNITSVVRSWRADAVICLGYVRREVEPGSVVRIGSRDGLQARVLERGPILP